ncbi:hypothetical protein DPMN_150682 [Dreissena polymorpha]|uniref:Uncharacterized protein n=1 Tax=Dreissena polymorpha TaxID=45954 RepID=A0A9D4J6J9_DREPO|nr:hypothetical protein DPMN_150682 [Dreissena polymorpha]
MCFWWITTTTARWDSSAENERKQHAGIPPQKSKDWQRECKKCCLLFTRPSTPGILQHGLEPIPEGPDSRSGDGPEKGSQVCDEPLP